MNITSEKVDDLNAILKVHIVKEDYEEKVNEVLKDYRKKANIKGFRPGKVPIGMIRKMYGPSVQLEEINKLVSEGVSNYITEEKLEILGDPLPNRNENESIDFGTQEEFTFSFDLGIAPEFEIKLSGRNKVTRYEVKIDKKLKSDFLENYQRRFGEHNVADVAEEEDMLKGDIARLSDEGEIIEGTEVQDSRLSIKVIKDDKIKKTFIGKKAGEVIEFDIQKAFPNEFEIAGLLQIDKEIAKDVKGNYRFTVAEVSRFKNADLDQELFDKVYGEGTVKNEEEFMTRMEEEIKDNLDKESEYKINLDTRKLAIDKTDISFPEDFLKRWLEQTNKDITQEQIDKDFPQFLEDLKWQLIRNKVAKENEIKVEEAELIEEAKNFTRIQFQQYGIFNAEEEQLEGFAKEMLKKEEDYRRIADKVVDDKVIAKIKELVKIESKKVTTEEFNKLFTN